MKKQSGSCAGSRGRAPTYRQPSWQFKGFPGDRTRITKRLIYIALDSDGDDNTPTSNLSIGGRANESAVFFFFFYKKIRLKFFPK